MQSRVRRRTRNTGLTGAAPPAPAGAPFDHANRRYGAPVSGHRFRAGSDAEPETRVSRAPRRPRPPGPRSTPQTDATLRLSAGPDSEPGPTQNPKHGAPARPAAPAPRRP